MRAPFHSPAAQRLVTRSERVCNRELGVGAHQSSTSYFCYGRYSLDPTITTAARATSEAVAGMRSESDGSSGGLSRGVGLCTNSSTSRRVIEGARRASPLATTLIAAISWSGGESLRRKPLAPRLDCLEDVLVKVERGQDDDPCPPVLREQAPSRREAIELGHSDVHQDDVGREAAGQLEHLEAFVRMTLVPAFLTLIGEKSCYIPRWLDRLLPNVTIEPPHDSKTPITSDIEGPAEPVGGH